MPFSPNSIRHVVRRRDTTVFVGLFGLVLVCKANILSLPYYWDELVYIIPSHWLAKEGLLGVLPGQHPPDTFFGHPPGLYLSLAFLNTLFGDEILVSHLFILIVAFLGVYFTYLLGSHLLNATTGLLAALLMFFTPLYFAQSGMVLGDLPITALGVMTVYYTFRKRYLPFLLCGTYLVLIKESSIAIVVVLLLYICATEHDQPGIKTKLLKYAIPLFVIAGFFTLQKITTGALLPNPYFASHSLFSLGPAAFLRKLFVVGHWIFSSQHRIMLAFLIFLAGILHATAFWRKEFALFIGIIATFLVAFAGLYALPRYILPTFPYFCILGAYAISVVATDVKRQFVVAGFVLALFVANLYGTGSGSFSFENDMQYVDVVLAHKAAGEYLDSTFPDATIVTIWPLSDVLSLPYLGYVKRPLRLAELGQKYDIILYTPHGSNQDDKKEKLAKLINEQGLSRHKRFETNGKYADVYLTPNITQ